MRILKQRKKDSIDRRMALDGVPSIRPGVSLAETADGCVRVSMTVRRGVGFLERIRPPQSHRSYELDEFGSFVIRMVDGERSVLELVNAFEQRYRMSRREVELSVVAFCKLLMQRDIVAVAIPREPSSARTAAVAAAVLLACAGGFRPFGVSAKEAPDVSALEGGSAESTMAALRAIDALGSRSPGSPGNLALEQMVADRFAANDFEHGEMRFAAPVFKPGVLTLDAGTNGVFTSAAMHPSLMRPGNFPQASFDTRLVYLGMGTSADLIRQDGVDLAGTVAVMEYGCGDRWLEFLRFGVKGFVFVADADASYPHLHATGKIVSSEISIPRYFLDGKAGVRLRALAQAQPGLAVRAGEEASRWEHGELRNLWTLIPGSDPKLGEQVIVYTASLDANSVVPSRAYGAQRTVNLHMLLELLEDFRAKPPLYSVMLVAINGHTQRYAGERNLAWHLIADSSAVEVMRDEIAKEMRVARLYAESYGRLVLDPVSDADKNDLHVMMEVMWKLDAMQGPGREVAYKDLRAAYDRSVADAFERDDAIDVLEDLAFPDQDSKLDLGRVTEADLRLAIAAARKEIIDGYDRFFVRRGRDPVELEQEKSEDLAMLDALAGLPFDACMEKARRVHGVFEDEKIFEVWRGTQDSSTGQRIYVKTPLQDAFKSQMNRIGQEIRVVRSQDRTDLSADERAASLAALEAQRDLFRSVLVLFNKMDIGVGRSRTYYRQIAVNDAQRGLLKETVDRFVAQYRQWQNRHQIMLERDAAASGIRLALGRRKIGVVIALEMDAHAERAGFYYQSPRVGRAWFKGFAEICKTLAAELGLGEDGSGFYADTLLANSGETMGHFFNQAANLPGTRLDLVPTSANWFYHAAKATPAFSLRSLLSGPGRGFGPDDTLGNIIPEKVHALQTNGRRFLGGLARHAEVISVSNLKPIQGMSARNPIWSTLLRSYSMEEFSGKPVSTDPIQGTLVALYQATRGLQGVPSIIDVDVINSYLGITDEAANTYFYGLAEARTLAPTAYQMDADFREVRYTIDKGRVQSSKQASSAVNNYPRVTLPMFRCVEYVFQDLRDPSSISASPIETRKLWPKSALGQSDPEKFGAHGVATLSPAPTHIANGPVGIYTQWRRPEFDPESIMVITDSRRMLLNSTPEHPRGEGFPDPRDVPADLVGQAAADMSILNKSRNEAMQGVVNQLLDQLIARGDKLKDAALARFAVKDHLGYLRTMYEALGNQVKAYQELRAMNADMLKAVIVFMALMLPFCFFLQKLLFNFKRLEHELGGFALLFFSTFLLFRFIHPAFRIAMSPEAIFIAFVLGAIGVFTTGVLRSRFSEEMTLLFRGVGGIGEEVGYGTVGTTAMLIGVQNMRRRRVRTSLTMATIVLVVFSMLAFSSVSRTAQPTVIPQGTSAPYTGFFYHWPGGRVIDDATHRMFGELFEGRADVRVRRIMQSLDTWRLFETDASDLYAGIHTISGMHPDDVILKNSMALVEGEPFSSNHANEIFLMLSTADALGLRASDIGRAKVQVMGRVFVLRGILDEQRYRLARDLNPNFPLVPFAKNQPGEGDADGNLDNNVQGVSERLVELSGIVVVPEGTAEELGAFPHTISVVFEDFRDVNRLGAELRRLLDVTSARFYVGTREPFNVVENAASPLRPGVYYVGSSYRTSIGGLARLLIPLIIAGSIILNTMLGTVYERKSEIAVFNAVGLNPTHIFLFFLAEAVVYSFIGAVGGYLIGQILTVSLQAVGLIKDLNVNFSSLMVVYAILFTMALVILSTLYPGYVATRTAVPSGQRKWTMPSHDGQQMHIVFPFIYRPRMAYGVMYYLRQFFDTMSELSLGDIVATRKALHATQDADGRPVLSMQYHMAMAPYDLGVTQEVSFVARYDDVVKSFRLHMDVVRLSGHDTNWVTTNRPYLERMRKFLIRWRNIDPTRQDWFVKHAVDMFAQDASPGNTVPEE
jgi:hypothetical protein